MKNYGISVVRVQTRNVPHKTKTEYPAHVIGVNRRTKVRIILLNMKTHQQNTDSDTLKEPKWLKYWIVLRGLCSFSLILHRQNFWKSTYGLKALARSTRVL